VITHTGALDRGVARDLVRRSDGKLVVAGSTYRRGSQYDFALVRYNPNGTVDKSFGARGDGKVYTDYFGGYDEANGLVRYNGGVVAAGYAEGGGAALARFTSDGRLDQRFGGGDGKVLTNAGGASDLIVQGDGKLVAAGGGGDFALVRYYPGGRLDTSFGGGDGKVYTDFGAADSVRGLALQPNGKIVAAGSSSEYYPDSDPGDGENDSYVLSGDAVARYLAE
jgi:uncharacterized delta-60 repeat protein